MNKRLWRSIAVLGLPSTLVAVFLLAGGRGLAAESSTARMFQNGDTVCFIGDSITRGGLYHAYVQLYYATRFPAWKLRGYNCGHSGGVIPGALARMDWDILAHKPNAATVMFGMNDLGPGYTSAATTPEQIEAAQNQKAAQVSTNLARLVTALRQASIRNIILIGPSIYDDTLAAADKPNNPRRNHVLEMFTQRVRALAADTGCGFADFHTLMTRINQEQQRRDPTFTLVGKDRVHPGPVGHFVMAYAFLKAQGAPQDVARIEINAAAGKLVESVNCAVTELEAGDNGLRFRCLANALPLAVPREAAPALGLVPFTGELNRETLAVKGLKSGEYDLKIDDAVVGQYSAAALDKGINLAENPKTPQHQQSQKVTAANQRRHDIEAGSVRAVAWVRHEILDRAKVNPADGPKVEEAFAGYLAKHPDAADFGRLRITQYPKDLANLPKDLQAIEDAIAVMDANRQPKSHTFSLKKL
jgi:lysophospholipase L1-like esterase